MDMKWILGFLLAAVIFGLVYAGIGDTVCGGFVKGIMPSPVSAAGLNSAPQEEEGPDPGMCLFCHAHAVEQWMLSKHYKNDVDCIACHGASEDHIRVEDNTIKPEIYFSEGGKKEIEFCRESCHTDLPADPHDSYIDDCCSCHLAHDFPSFTEEYFTKPEKSGK